MDQLWVSLSESNQNQYQPSSEQLIIQEKLQQLEEFILTNNNIPLTPYKVINEEKLFQYMDQVWESLPYAFEQAQQEAAEIRSKAEKEDDQ